MGIRLKILSGFLTLAVMLFLAGIWSVYELNHVGLSVQGLLEENYRSINAAEAMIEAVEREDSGLLLMLGGKKKEGRSILEKGDSQFREALSTAAHNVTIPGEQEYVEEIRRAYSVYQERLKTAWTAPEFGKDAQWYIEQVHPAFGGVKEAVSGLIVLNDRIMYKTASDLKARAQRAVMPGVVAIVSALIFSLVFNYFVNYYLVSPMLRVTHAIQDYLKIGKPVEIHVESRDELGALADAIRELMSRHQEKR